MLRAGEPIGYAVVLNVLDESHLLDLGVVAAEQGQLPGAGRQVAALNAGLDNAAMFDQRGALLADAVFVDPVGHAAGFSRPAVTSMLRVSYKGRPMMPL